MNSTPFQIITPARDYSKNNRKRSAVKPLETLKTLALLTMTILAFAGVIAVNNLDIPAPDLSKAPQPIKNFLLIK